MNDKMKKAVSWWATAAVCIAYGIFSLATEPAWWTTAIAIAVPVISVIVGKPWMPPEPDK